MNFERSCAPFCVLCGIFSSDVCLCVPPFSSKHVTRAYTSQSRKCTMFLRVYATTTKNHEKMIPYVLYMTIHKVKLFSSSQNVTKTDSKEARLFKRTHTEEPNIYFQPLHNNEIFTLSYNLDGHRSSLYGLRI